MRGLKLLGLAGLATVAAAGVWADEQPEENEVRRPDTKRHVRKIVIECDGEDCDAGTRMLHLGDGTAWIGDQDCNGDECDKQVYVFKTGEAPMAWAGGDHDFRFYTGPRGFLGVQFLPLTDDLATHFGSDADSAVMVSKVIDDSPAQRAGLEVGDIISAVDGESLDRRGLPGALRDKEGGDEVSLDVLRNGRSFAVSAVLDKRDGFASAPHGGRHEVIAVGGPGGIPTPDVGPALDADELCAGLEECEVRIECADEVDCTCEVNGASVECP